MSSQVEIVVGDAQAHDDTGKFILCLINLEGKAFDARRQGKDVAKQDPNRSVRSQPGRARIDGSPCAATIWGRELRLVYA